MKLPSQRWKKERVPLERHSRQRDEILVSRASGPVVVVLRIIEVRI